MQHIKWSSCFKNFFHIILVPGTWDMQRLEVNDLHHRKALSPLKTGKWFNDGQSGTTLLKASVDLQVKVDNKPKCTQPKALQN